MLPGNHPLERLQPVHVDTVATIGPRRAGYGHGRIAGAGAAAVTPQPGHQPHEPSSSPTTAR
ncbi:hypothetical protein PV779_51890 [Streptomyces sp. ID01-9D]|nr:hypothetical protein [Streptomyces sp. ID01-9D]